MADVTDESGRRETELERLDRNLVELLQEVRVAQAGVQILFAFLLALPFTARFDRVTDGQRVIFALAVAFSAASSALLTAPAALHRLTFRRAVKGRVVFLSNRLTLAGLACLAIAMTSAVALIADVLFGTLAAVLATVVALGMFGWLWLALPLSVRASAAPASPQTPERPPESPPTRSTRGAAR